MKKFFLFGLFFLSILGISQQKDSNVIDLKNRIDSLPKKTKDLTDSITNQILTRPENITGIDMDRNIRNITELLNKRREKQRKSAIIRIAIGIGFLIILVIGLSRKKKGPANK